MEQKLKKLFDYQKFEQNQKLAKLIDETLADCKELSEDELSFVSAAGEDACGISKSVRAAKAEDTIETSV